jgi:hypothetical protein
VAKHLFTAGRVKPFDANWRGFGGQSSRQTRLGGVVQNAEICRLSGHTMKPIFDSSSTHSIGAVTRKRDAVLTIVAALTIIFGISE